MGKCIKIFLIAILCFSCKDADEKQECFNIDSNINRSTFFRLSDYNDIIFFDDGTKFKLPNLKVNNYRIHSNFIKNDIFYINRVKDNYEYCVLKVKKDSVLNVIDSICFTSTKGNYIRDSYLSNNKLHIAMIYDDGNLSDNSNSSLEIEDLRTGKIIYKKNFKNRFFLTQNPWSYDDKHIVLYNSLKEIFTFNIETGEIKRLTTNGTKAMWLQSLNKIAYLKNRNTLAVYDLATLTEDTYQIKDKLFYKNFIHNYYWFPNQNKFYIRSRFSNFLGDKAVPWKNESFILEYECLK